jgi:hypothetical protein
VRLAVRAVHLLECARVQVLGEPFVQAQGQHLLGFHHGGIEEPNVVHAAIHHD